MKLVALFLLCMCSCIGPVLAGERLEPFSWHETYESALAEAKETGKPILLTFR